MTVEPLDADTLAEGERWRTTPGVTAGVRWGEWVMKNSEALLAVARDHARLAATLRMMVDRCEGQDALAGSPLAAARDALSAEAGDTDDQENPDA